MPSRQTYLSVPFVPILTWMLVVALLSACGPWRPDPSDDRPRVAAPAETRVPVKPVPPIYEVQRGDTLYSIAFRHGLDWRVVARWNGIEEPFVIRPGQELRLTEPPRVADVRRSTQPREEPPRPSPPESTTPEPTVEPDRQPASPAETSVSRQVAGVSWRWPTEGRVVRPFDPAATRRGLGIGGQAGQSVVAAADGEVVYSGTALIGYGNLIIIKHSDTMLSAYGHNQRRLVDEGERVRAGQTIAEMGQNERDEDILHFEIRRNGQAVNPLEYLPRR
jgi:lipoprotein NlpD